MRVIEISAAGCGDTLNLGYRGETAATEIRFDFSSWAEAYGSPGAVELYVRRYSEGTAYPVVLAIDGSEAVWTVSNVDTDVVGYGAAEFVYRIDDAVVKSAVFGTFVAADIGQPATDPPDAFEDWLAQLGEMAAGTLINAQRAETAASAAEAAQAIAESAQEAAEDARRGAEAAEGAAAASEAAAAESESNAEAWAVGERGGEPVPDTDETWHNNARFYAEAAGQIATENGYAALWVDDDGNLWCTRTSNIAEELSFALTAAGELEVTING